MILGIGIDIININRIEKAINKYGDRFINKCFVQSEIQKSESRRKKIQSFAKRFAAKEACAKALGTGLSKGVFWKDIEVRNDKLGKPIIILHNKALRILKQISSKNTRIEISLSDEKNYAISNVIIFKDEK